MSTISNSMSHAAGIFHTVILKPLEDVLFDYVLVVLKEIYYYNAILLILSLCAIVAAVLPVFIIRGMGFKAQGVVKGSLAASAQSLAKNVVRQSCFARLQSVGTKGLSLVSRLILGSLGVVTGAVVIYWKSKNHAHEVSNFTADL